MADWHRNAFRRHTARVIALVAVVGLSIGALAGVGTASSSKGSGGGNDITFGVEYGTTAFCPPSQQWAISGIQIATAVYDTLVVPNSKGEMVPYLAESVTPNADNTVWTIKLRPDITFHNGEPLDAAAVKLNIDAFTGAVKLTPAGVADPDGAAVHRIGRRGRPVDASTSTSTSRSRTSCRTCGSRPDVSSSPHRSRSTAPTARRR